MTDSLHLFQGLVIFALSFVPGLLWAKSGGSRFPVFEPIMLLCANAYACYARAPLMPTGSMRWKTKWPRPVSL